MIGPVVFVALAVVAWLMGIQVSHRDFLLLTMRYDYRMGMAQCVSYVSLLAVAALSCVMPAGVLTTLTLTAAGLALAFVTEWALARLHPSSLAVTALVRVLAVVAMATAMAVCDTMTVLPLAAMGWYVRNSALGVVHRNPFVLACRMRRSPVTPPAGLVVQVEIPPSMPDFSHAGSHHTDAPSQRYVVTDHGIYPDADSDLLEPLQALIDQVGQSGGGTIFFPRGKYLFNKSGKKQFLRINYSHITLEGEVDATGRPVAQLVNCGSLDQGHAQPWLSPFFITTGERLQPSNQFWGLQFGRWRQVEMKSDSMSDPGSDGALLSPAITTHVVATSLKGDDVLHVENTAGVGRYILLGLYNTDDEATLLKDILGQSRLRPEWKAAMRAGVERAPSFQWLVEVKQVIDSHTLQLVQPLWRDCAVENSPVVCGVEMLEDISIRNLRLSSRWNGLFRHHGCRHYYNVAQAQEMDYGWNAINLKRVAHAVVEDVVIENFTNPLCVTDSRNVTCQRISIGGYDGHQGIKVYSHACDNLFRDINFYSHFADMMGGEGNAYGNVFSRIHYLNPSFHPVEYDFHGFSEAPFSPPCYNLFERVDGFAAIHSSGPLHMQPACGRGNVWWNCVQEGERRGGNLLHQGHYDVRLTFKNRMAIVARTAIAVLRRRALSPGAMRRCYREMLQAKSAARLMSVEDYARFYTDFHFCGIHTVSDISLTQSPTIYSTHWNTSISIPSLYEAQQSSHRG
ncbi:MAG: hypothetical protein IJ775_02895 [Muribaculaceae bacterium]|nr:hypothetical protein [Muribaculaceae bacterium]